MPTKHFLLYPHSEEPTQMDRLVYDAVADCHITPDQYPSIYRWRHTVALYPPKEREKSVLLLFSLSGFVGQRLTIF